MIIGYDANERPVQLWPNDRCVHSYIIGSSGSGKSKFLEWLIRADLDTRQGFALIDPHGDLYEEISSYCAHHVLDRKIIRLNLSGSDAVIGFNPFQAAAEGDIAVQVDRRVSATMHAWNVPDADQTPTLARTLRLIYTVMLEQRLGMPQVEHLIDFNAGKVRGHLIDRLSTSLIQKEWRELQALQPRDWRAETLSVKNRLFKFLTSKALTRVMGIPGRSIDLSDVMDKGKVLLVNLAPSDHLSHENARVFGALLVNEFFECALRRAKQPSDRRQPYYLYLDEFQSFVSPDTAAMLDQVRKFGLFLVLAHQRFGQVDDDVVEAALTNCGMKAVFGGLSVPNARRMAEELFIGDLDPKRIKVAIYQTKFWPTYARDKVYSKGRSHTETTGTTHGSSSGHVSISGSGEYFDSSDWFGGSRTSSSSSAGSSSSSGDSSSTADSFGETESEADIPILLPVPFEELSSLQYYSVEEQLLELTAALKEQFQRHCFIKIKQQRTQPLLVPFVSQPYTSEANRRWYLDKQAERHGALPAARIDEIISEQDAALLRLADLGDPQEQPETPRVEPPARRRPTKRKARAKAEINPLDRVLKDMIGKE